MLFSFSLNFSLHLYTPPTLHPKPQTHHLTLLAHPHLTEVDGEDGVRAGALGVHLGAGCGPGQSTELQTLQQLQHTHTHNMDQKKKEDSVTKEMLTVDTVLFCGITTHNHTLVSPYFMKVGTLLRRNQVIP